MNSNEEQVKSSCEVYEMGSLTVSRLIGLPEMKKRRNVVITIVMMTTKKKSINIAYVCRKLGLSVFSHQP